MKLKEIKIRAIYTLKCSCLKQMLEAIKISNIYSKILRLKHEVIKSNCKRAKSIRIWTKSMDKMVT